MTRTWTFDSVDDIITELEHVTAELREGSLVFGNLEVNHVMGYIRDAIIENAEVGYDND